MANSPRPLRQLLAGFIGVAHGAPSRLLAGKFGAGQESSGRERGCLDTVVWRLGFSETRFGFSDMATRK